MGRTSAVRTETRSAPRLPLWVRESSWLAEVIGIKLAKRRGGEGLGVEWHPQGESNS